MTRNALLWLILLAAASGCANQTSPKPPTERILPLETNATFPGSMLWNHCKALYSDYSYLGEMNPSPRPTGWTNASILAFGSDLHTLLYHCDRIHLGAFEDGPVNFVFEYSDNITPPPSCEQNRTGLYFHITMFATDKPSLNEALSRMGMPVRVGVFNLTEVYGPQSYTQTWRWSVDGGKESTLTSGTHVSLLPGQAGSLDRFMWYNATMLAYMDQEYLSHAYFEGAEAAYGTMYPPMMYAQGGINTFAGEGTVGIEEDASGPIHYYSDYECKQPLN